MGILRHRLLRTNGWNRWLSGTESSKRHEFHGEKKTGKNDLGGVAKWIIDSPKIDWVALESISYCVAATNNIPPVILLQQRQNRSILKGEFNKSQKLNLNRANWNKIKIDLLSFKNSYKLGNKLLRHKTTYSQSDVDYLHCFYFLEGHCILVLFSREHNHVRPPMA